MTKIILFALIVGFVAVNVKAKAVPAELAATGLVARAACLEETGTTADLVDKTADGEFPDDGKLKCYFKCIFDKFELIENNEINFDAMLLLVPESMKEKGTNMIQTCRKTSGTDLCDKAFNFNKCFFEKTPEEYFAV